MAEKTFKLKWPNSLGREWMNIDTLKLCLFSKEHTQDRFLAVEEVKKSKAVLGWEKAQRDPSPKSDPPKLFPWWRRIFKRRDVLIVFVAAVIVGCLAGIVEIWALPKLLIFSIVAVLAAAGLLLQGMLPYWKWEKRIDKQIKEIREQNKKEVK